MDDHCIIVVKLQSSYFPSHDQKSNHPQNQKYIFYLLPVELLIYLDCVGSSFGETSCHDVCLLSNIEPDGTVLMVFKVSNSNVSFQKSRA